MNVQLFIPCFVDQLFPETAFNMVKVLEKAGCTVSYNANQTCCGQPAFNAGFWDESRSVCTKFLKDFSGTDYIVAPSASCVGFVRNYYTKLFDNSSLHNQVKDLGNRLFEFSEFMIKVLKVEDVGASLPGKATYHDSCAGLRECRIKTEPRQLLSKVKGLEITEMNDVETCCGFGGTFAVKFEAISVGMGEQKVENALATDARYLISTDMSCLMHLDGYIKNKGYDLKAMHLADVLASGW
ncbi:MAG: Fe-S oxidoreductase [Sphingobacteriales bacterium SCN 48-20]|uniref:(Fe-S)-binding protein n=1 Tax=Terrimonas ferruginea TaxID=249 RepID=UPI000416B88C|nr:(Fe-S)-binding protein [Terrimonas ferruginea]MBN8784914.1 (Fe-S)-binding protein [Terrimonas ferruginea]ODT90614.1 MAG: Fe-S oxidoreductase [Sphingobacteriales bacterium SCN 48-20]OJW43691.1 MAG: Fe-S oxidoreductase [Sphingobacteriales bacterium 48-107]